MCVFVAGPLITIILSNFVNNFIHKTLLRNDDQDSNSKNVQSDPLLELNSLLEKEFINGL
jgi:hypothetical protein